MNINRLLECWNISFLILKIINLHNFLLSFSIRMPFALFIWIKNKKVRYCFYARCQRYVTIWLLLLLYSFYEFFVCLKTLFKKYCIDILFNIFAAFASLSILFRKLIKICKYLALHHIYCRNLATYSQFSKKFTFCVKPTN